MINLLGDWGAAKRVKDKQLDQFELPNSTAFGTHEPIYGVNLWPHHAINMLTSGKGSTIIANAFQKADIKEADIKEIDSPSAMKYDFKFYFVMHDPETINRIQPAYVNLLNTEKIKPEGQFVTLQHLKQIGLEKYIDNGELKIDPAKINVIFMHGLGQENRPPTAWINKARIG